MCLKTILLHTTNDQHFSILLTALAGLAARTHVHAVGLAILPAPIMFPAGIPGHPYAVAIDEQRDAMRHAADVMHAQLDQAAKAHGFSREWRLEDATHTTHSSIALAAARTADLIMTSQHDAGWLNLEPTSTMYHLLLEAGRPVLVVPKTLSSPFSIERVLIAWNGSQQATRAIADALPLVKHARHIKLLHFTQSGARNSQELGSVTRLAESLARHDIVAIPEELGLRGTEAGPAILSAVKAENADLLVMGCYGHSRLRELVLGGATRHVLQHMTIPVLMSH
jgi:nucleotide-binding universal stress UspA family protein